LTSALGKRVEGVLRFY